MSPIVEVGLELRAASLFVQPSPFPFHPTSINQPESQVHDRLDGFRLHLHLRCCVAWTGFLLILRLLLFWLANFSYPGGHGSDN